MNTLLIGTLVGTVFVILLGAMLLLLRFYQQSLGSGVRTEGIRTISQVADMMEDYLQGIRDDMDMLATEFQLTDEERAAFLQDFLKIRPDVIDVTTYDASGGLINWYSADPVATISPSLTLNKQAMDASGGEYISPPHVVELFEGYYPWVVTMIHPVSTTIGEKYLALDIRCTNMSEYINGVGIGDRGYCFLIDRDNNMVYHPQQQLINAGLKQEDNELIAGLEDGSDMENNIFYFVQTIESGKWKVVGISFVQEVISNSLNSLATILLLAMIVLLIITLIVSWRLSRTISDPMHELVSAMGDFEKDADHFVYQPVKGAREVQELSESFGHMVGKIQQLVETERREEMILRKTELRALQAQINPHFLYNSLDSISWMCEQGRNEDAVLMVNALARLFRISISRGHELIPVGDELKHAESYLQIQSYRYKNQFRYSFEVDESCLEYFCNKITLQPIIENAIYHGINGLVDDGEIIVRVYASGDDVLFEVRDNGTGMSQEQIRAVMNKTRTDQSGIGIKNVNDRLKIYFGERYGIRIDSEPDEGTSVIVRMPKVREAAEYENR